jgi:hypothetical protein
MVLQHPVLQAVAEPARCTEGCFPECVVGMVCFEPSATCEGSEVSLNRLLIRELWVLENTRARLAEHARFGAHERNFILLIAIAGLQQLIEGG